MSRIISCMDPAINPPTILDGSSELSSGLTEKSLKRTTQNTNKSSVNKLLENYIEAKVKEMNPIKDVDPMRMKELKLRAMQFAAGKSKEELDELEKYGNNFLM